MSKRKPIEAVSGSYTPIPHAVLDCCALVGASPRAKALLLDMLRQHNGRNNGHLQLTRTWLKGRGWTSTDQLQKAKTELLDRGLILKTKMGDLRNGPDWYALTWLPISDFSGLDIKPTSYYPGHWRLMDSPDVVGSKNCESGTASRNNTVPSYGTESASLVPPRGTKTVVSTALPVPPHGNNECCQLSTGQNRSRVVGKRGASGAKSASAVTEVEATSD
jgi:hypothetical protein